MSAEGQTKPIEFVGNARSQGDVRPAIAPRRYDFTRRETLPRSVLLRLERACQVFADDTSATLSKELRATVRMRPVSIRQLTIKHYAQSVVAPTIAAIFKLTPRSGCCGLLQLDLSLGLYLVARLLGDNSEDLPKARALTEVEKAVLEIPLRQILGELEKACASLINCQTRLIGLINSVRNSSMAETKEMLVLVEFELQLASVKGSMAIGLPASVFNVEAKASALEQVSFTDGSMLREKLAASLSLLPAACVVRVGRTNISAAELTTLAEGDVLPLEATAASTMELLVAGRPRFRCQAMQSDGRYAVKIIERI